MTRKRKWSWWVVGTVGAVVLILVVAQPLLGIIVERKLVATVEDRTNASLKVGGVTYLPPYGVRVSDAVFEVPDEGGKFELVKVKRLELKLAKLPLKPGPLVIERVEIERPEVHLVRTEHGLLGIDGIVKEEDKSEEKVKKKLSEVFELRHLEINEGSVVYEDRTKAGSVPMVWRDLNVKTETRPTSAAIYAYDFAAETGGVASVASVGTFDVDNLVLEAKSLKLAAKVERDAKESPVPAEVQKVLGEYSVEGKLEITGSGKVPLKEMTKAEFRIDVALDEAKGKLPKVNQPVDSLAARVRVTGRQGEAISTLVALEGMSGPNVLHVDDGEVLVDLGAKTWELRQLDMRVDATAVGVRPFQMPASAPAAQKKMRAGGTLALTAAGSGPLPDGAMSPEEFRDKVKFEVVATADDFHAQPPGFDAPLRLITGAPIVANQDVIRISNVTGRYGYDQVQVNTLRVPLRDLPRVIRVEQLSATVTFDRNTPGYPGKLGEWSEKVRPEGPFHVGGMAMYDREAGLDKIDYHLLLHSERGALTYEEDGKKVAVTRINADVLVDPGKAQLQYCQANVFGGLVSVTGGARFGKGVPLTWEGKGSVRDFDLRTCVQGVTGKEFDTQKLSGQANLRFDLTGGTTPESIKGSAEAVLYNGRLFELPVLGEVLGKAGMEKGLVADEAAAAVRINESKIIVRHMAAGSPVLGVQGYGIIGFDNSIDANVIVAPLGQWKDRFKSTGIPLVSKALGEVAGAIQGAVNAAASTLLYEFHVTGTRSEPKITPVPAPILTKGTAALFGKMMGAGEKGRSLEEEMRRLGAEAEGEKEGRKE